MNTGRICKNLTDALLVVVAMIALICVVVKIVGFEEEYKIAHPSTKEEITVSKPLEDPYTETYVKLFAAFSIASIVGFSARGKGWLGIVSSACVLVISVNYFAEDLIGKFGFLYFLVAATALAGSIVYTYYYYTEVRKALPAEDQNKSE